MICMLFLNRPENVINKSKSAQKKEYTEPLINIQYSFYIK